MKSHGHRSLESYTPWDSKESDMTEQLTHMLHSLKSDKNGENV